MHSIPNTWRILILLFLIPLALTWLLSLRPIRLKIGDYYFFKGSYDQAFHWYEKIIRKAKLKGDYSKRVSSEFENDLIKLKSSTEKVMEARLLLVTQLLGHWKTNLTDPANIKGTISLKINTPPHLKGIKSAKDNLISNDIISIFQQFSKGSHILNPRNAAKAKEELLLLNNLYEYVVSYFGERVDTNELDYLVAIGYLFRGLIDEKENNLSLANSNYEKAIKLFPDLSNQIADRRTKILFHLAEGFFCHSPLNWVKAKEFYETLISCGHSSVILFINLGYIYAKFNNFRLSYGCFHRAYELMKDTDVEESIAYIRGKGIFLYPDDLKLIPQRLVKRYPFLNEISFFEINNLFNILGVKVNGGSGGFVGRTGVKSPVNIVIRSAGYLVGDYGLILINGENVSQNKRGYNIVVVNSQTGEVEKSLNFDTCGSKDDVRRMKDFIIGIEKNKIVCVAVADEASGQLSLLDGKIFEEIGAKENLHGRIRWGHSILGIKGAKCGEALESISEKPVEVYTIISTSKS